MTRKKFNAILAKYGVTLDELSEDGSDLIVDSPAGKVFRATGTHSMSEPFSNRGGQSWKSEAYRLMAERIEMGLENCEIEDCDVCND